MISNMDNMACREDLVELNERVNMINYSIDSMRSEFNDSISNLVRCLSDDNKKLREELSDLQSYHIKALYDDNRKLGEDLCELQVLQRSLETYIEEKRIQDGTAEETTCDVPNCLVGRHFERILKNIEVKSNNDNELRCVNTDNNIELDNDVLNGEQEGLLTPINSFANENDVEDSVDNFCDGGNVFLDERTSHFYQKIRYIRTLLMMKKEISSKLVVDDCGCINILEETSNTLQIQQQNEMCMDFSDYKTFTSWLLCVCLSVCLCP